VLIDLYGWVNERIRSPLCWLTSMSSGSSYWVLIEGMMKRIVQIVIEKSIRKAVARSGDTPQVD